MTPAGLLLLADARFPAGGHAHSAGTETAVAVGDVYDVRSLERYLRARLDTTGRVDAAFTAATCSMLHDAAAGRLAENRTGQLLQHLLDEIDVEYSARVPSPYLRAVSRRLGRQLTRATSGTWSTPVLDAVAATPGGPHQPVALGAAAAVCGVEPADAAVLAVHHLAGAVASAAVRLLGLDPVETAAVQAAATSWSADRLRHDRPWQVERPCDLPADGGTLTEILGERHGSLDARLFVA